jgi:ribonuclease P protein component
MNHGTGMLEMGKIIKIKTNRDFQRIYRKGRYAASRGLVIYVQPNPLQINRIGITASKKYGKSVQRNRIRRLIRESYHALQEKIKPGHDFIVVARKADETDPGYQQILKEMRYLLKKLNVMTDKNSEPSADKLPEN